MIASRPARPLPTPALAAVLVAATACSGPGEDAPLPPHASFRRARVLVADGEDGLLHVLDVEAEAVIAELDAGGPAELHATRSGSFAAVTQPESGTVRLVRTGVVVIDHTEGFVDPHIHIFKSPPAWLDLTLSGTRPGHVSGQHGWITAFFDGDASTEADAQAVSEEALFGPETPEVLHLPAGPAHSGLAARWGERFVVTGAQANGHPPGVLHLLDGDGEPIDTLDGCADVAGQTAAADTLVLGCSDGALVLAPGGPEHGRKVPFPPGLPERPRSLQAHIDQTFVIGSAGATTIVRLPIREGEGELLEAPLPLCDLGFEASQGTELVGLSDDGSLIVLDAATGGELQRLDVVDPFDCAASVRPHLGLAPERAYVSDPNGARVIEIDLRRMEPSAEYGVPGRPANLVVLGIDEANRHAGLSSGDERRL